MALSIPVPDASASTQEIALAGVKYDFVYEYNARDNRYRLSIYYNNTPVVLGVKIMESQFLLDNLNLSNFSHGDIFCTRMEDSGEPVGRNNIGARKPYELIYYTNAEIASILGE